MYFNFYQRQSKDKCFVQIVNGAIVTVNLLALVISIQDCLFLSKNNQKSSKDQPFSWAVIQLFLYITRLSYHLRTQRHRQSLDSARMEGQTDIKNQQGSSHQQQNPASKHRERRTRSEPNPFSGRVSDQQIETYPDQQRCRSIISISTQNQQQIFLSGPSLYGSQQNLQIFEWKYRQALESLEKELELGKMGSVLQDLQQEMLECFQTFRQHLINSIEINRKWALVQVSKHHEPQRKKLKQDLDETRKQSKKAVSSYEQLERQYRARLDRKDPQQYDLKGAMERKFIIYTNFSTQENYLNANLKKMYEKVERERLQIERAFAKQLEYKQKILAKQRETHEMINRRIERKVKENLTQTINDFMSTFQKQKRQKLDGRIKNKFLSSKQLTFLQEYFQKISNLEEIIRSKEISSQSIQEEFQDLKAFYMILKENLIDTINTQENLKDAEEQLDNAHKKLLSAAQEYSDCYQTQNANKEENMLQIFKKLYDDFLQTVKELEIKLDTLDKNAKRKKRLSLGELQSMLERLEGKKDFHVDLEKRILQRAQLLTKLEEVQRKRILENVRSAQEQELPKKEIGRSKTAAKELAKTHHEVKKECSQPTIIEVMQESSQSINNEVKYERQPAANQVKQEFVEPAINQEKIEMPPLTRIPLFIGEFPVRENIKRVEPDKEKGQQKAGSREPFQVRSKDSKQRESENKSIRVKKLGKKSEDGSIESNQQNIGQQQSIKSKKERSSESKNKRMGQTAESSTDQIIKEAIKHDKLQLVEIKSDKKLQKRGIKSNRGSHQGSQNQVNDKIEAPSDESGSVNSQKKDKILLRAQQAYVKAKKKFQREYKAMTKQIEKDSSESKDKLFLVKMLHLRRCQSLMSFKALEASLYNQDIQKTKRELAIDRYKECRQNAQGLYKSYKTAQQMYFKVAGSGTQVEKAREKMFESAKQMFLQQKETVQQLQYRMKQIESSAGEIASINKMLIEEGKEIQTIEEDFKQFDQLVEDKELRWVQRNLHILRSSDPDLEEIITHHEGKLKELENSRQARKKAFDSIKKRKLFDE